MNTIEREHSLVDRYVHAVVQRLPEEQRDDVGDELRATLADRVESLLEQDPGRARAEAEHTAVAELGDPDRLAADYAGRKQHLIGPDLFHVWWRVLRGILLVAVPTATLAVAVIDVLGGASVGAVVGGAAAMAFNLVVQIAFWTTVAFVVIDRTGAAHAAGSPLTPWQPDDLPQVPENRGSLGELVLGVAFLALVAVALVWQHLASPLHAGSERLPLLDPDLWPSWMAVILGLVVVEIGFEVVKYRTGWTRDMAVANLVLGLLFSAPWVYLAATDRLLNPAAVARIQQDWAGFDPGVVNTLVFAMALLIWAWDSVDGWRKSRTAA